MRLVKDTTGQNREVPIKGTQFVVKFINNYASVDEGFIHHFESQPGFQVMPKGAIIPTEEKKEQPLDVKAKK